MNDRQKEELMRVVEIVNNHEGIFGVKPDLEKVYGKKNVSFLTHGVLRVYLKNGEHITIVGRLSALSMDENDVLAQNGRIVVGYSS